MKRILLGKIATAHGIKGLVKIQFYGEDVSLLESAPIYTDADTGKTISITLKNQMAKHWLAEIEGVDDRNAAEALRGTDLYINRSDMPETEDDEYYYEDITGLPARNPQGETIGTIKAVHNFGAGDLLEIKPASGGETFFLSFTESTVPDITAEYVTIILPEEIEAKED